MKFDQKLSLAVLCCIFALTPSGTLGDTLLVASEGTGDVLQYDGSTGAFIHAFVPSGSGGLLLPTGLTLGSDGSLYVSYHASLSTPSGVLRYNGSTGSFLGTFVAPGTLQAAGAMTFGPDGSLYVTDFLAGVVQRYSGTSGAYMGVFATSGVGTRPSGLVFGPDGNLYLADEISVKEFNGSTGAFMRDFIPGGSGPNGSGTPVGLVFGPDGSLYVSDEARDVVLRYNGTTGVLIGEIATTSGRPQSLAFGADDDLYIGYDSGVGRYDPSTETFLQDFVTPGSGGLASTADLVFTQEGVPEPSTVALFVIGLFCFCFCAKWTHSRNDSVAPF